MLVRGVAFGSVDLKHGESVGMSRRDDWMQASTRASTGAERKSCHFASTGGDDLDLGGSAEAEGTGSQSVTT